MTVTRPGEPGPRTTEPATVETAAPAAPRRRDAAIDTIRGICIVTMTFSHLAMGTLADKVTHPAPWVDGASGFVLMSGLVLGMVQPGRIGRDGILAAEIKLLRRAGLLYVAHVLTVLLAVVAGRFAPDVRWLPRTGDHGGIWGTIRDTLLLQVNPPDIDILSLYVLLLLSAMIGTALLAGGLAWLLGVLSVAVYVVASAVPSAFILPIGNGDPSKFNAGAWQLLFLSALAVGWYWKRADLRRRLTSPRALVLGAGLWAGVTLVGVLFARMGLIPGIQPAMDQAFYDKTDQGLGRFVLAWAAFVTLYAGLTWLLRTFRLRWAAPVETIGKRSLASFIVLTVITVLVPVVAGDDVPGAVATVIAVASLFVMYGFVLLRYGRPGRPADVPSGTPAG